MIGTANATNIDRSRQTPPAPYMGRVSADEVSSINPNSLLDLLLEETCPVRFNESIARMAAMVVKPLKCGLAESSVGDVWHITQTYQFSSPSNGQFGHNEEEWEFVSKHTEAAVAQKTVKKLTMPVDGGQRQGRGRSLVIIPMRCGARDRNALVMISERDINSMSALTALHRIANTSIAWWKRRDDVEANWITQTLASTIELVSEIEQSRSVKEACEKASYHIAKLLRCNSVAIGVSVRGKARLMAISNCQDSPVSSPISAAYQQVIYESGLRGEEAIYTPSIECTSMLLAHKSLAREIAVDAVYSSPLLVRDNAQFGCIIATGSEPDFARQEFQSQVSILLPRIAEALSIVQRLNRPVTARIREKLMTRATRFHLCIVLFFLTLLTAVLLVPTTYKVRCNASVDPSQKRLVTTHVEGLIAETHVRPGDRVSAGALLVTLDSQEIRLQLERLRSERQRSQRSREIELNRGDVAAVILAELEQDRIDAEIELLEFQRSNLEIRSPIDGVVLSGSPASVSNTAVARGQVLFELGPMNDLVLFVEIPASERSYIREGMGVECWIEGQEGFTISTTIGTIRPVSEIRRSRNTFIAECKIADSPAIIQPGMTAQVRIDTDKQPLAWCLFHKPWGALKTYLPRW